MPDQAYDLRKLAVCRRPAPSSRTGRATVVAVGGGKGGVGTTTVALNLAAALAESGRRTMFIDADPRGADSLRVGSSGAYTRPSPVLKLMPGGREWRPTNGRGTEAAGRLLDSIDDGQTDADAAVIDVGNTIDRAVGAICRRADRVLVVVTPNPAAVLGAYAALATLTVGIGREHGGQPPWPAERLNVLMNMASNVKTATAAYERLAWTARRLLGLSLRSVGCMPTAVDPTADGNAELCLNVRTLPVDTVRKLLVSGDVLNWRKETDFSGEFVRPAPV